jgi:hypothetical protein
LLDQADQGRIKANAEQRSADADALTAIEIEAAANCKDEQNGKMTFAAWFSATQTLLNQAEAHLAGQEKDALSAQRANLLPATYRTYSIFLFPDTQPVSGAQTAALYRTFKSFGAKLQNARAAVWLTAVPASASLRPDVRQDAYLCANVFRLPACGTATYLVTTSKPPAQWAQDSQPVVLEFDGLTIAQINCFTNAIVAGINGTALTASDVLLQLQREASSSLLAPVVKAVNNNPTLTVFVAAVNSLPLPCRNPQ